VYHLLIYIQGKLAVLKILSQPQMIGEGDGEGAVFVTIDEFFIVFVFF
jgi:hypothetical protein